MKKETTYEESKKMERQGVAIIIFGIVFWGASMILIFWE